MLAHGPGEKRSGHGGIHPTGQGQQDPALPHPLPQDGDLLLHEGGHVPVAPAAADVPDEAPQHVRALGRMLHLGMKLGGVEPPVSVLHGGHGAVRRVGRRPEPVGKGGDPVRMAHPADRAFRDVREQGRIGRVHGELRPAVLGNGRRLHPTA